MNILSLILLLCSATMQQPEAKQTSEKPQPEVVHPKMGQRVEASDSSISIVLAGKKQNYDWRPGRTRDADISSPKSVNIHPSGKKYYVNSLEGGKTLVFDMATAAKTKVIHHRFTRADSALWAPSTPLYKFRHYTENLRSFTGKPVESAFSHGGRYLWVPYYRRSFDINAQDPSAVAVIDTRTDSIVRLMDAGVLPKMIASSPDGKYVAIANWGDNTVGIIDCASADPRRWRNVACVAIDGQLFHNFSLTETVDRDRNSGNCLRATTFTPDSRYLLVGCMGGSGGIAVIDMASKKWIGKLHGMMGNMRHMEINHGNLYVSINSAGYVQRIGMDHVTNAINQLSTGSKRNVTLEGWKSCKVGKGARTLTVSPDGRYVYVACNIDNSLHVVDASSMKVIARVPADSYPVGLDISSNGRLVILTSQGRNRQGGNAIDLFRILYRTKK